MLSQNTNDRNRDVAYARLRERFPTWEEVRDAPTEEVEAAIKPGGLSATKAPRIQEILGRLGDHPDLDWLAEAPRERGPRLPHRPAGGRAQDRGLRADLRLRPPGDPGGHPRPPGRRPARPVPAGASFEEAHDEMLAITPPEDAYELHINLIQHGRAVCRPAPLRRVRPAPDVPVLPEPDQYAAPPEMKRSTFVIFGLVVLILGVGVPAWAITHEGSQSASPEEVPPTCRTARTCSSPTAAPATPSPRPAPTA